MRLSLELKLTWKVLSIFFVLFSFVGLILHYIYIVYLQGFIYFYYGFVGIGFLFTLKGVQRGYLAYYSIKSKKDAKELIDSGGRPSDILLQQKGIKTADEIAGFDPETVEYVKQKGQPEQVISERDLKDIEKKMRKKVKF